MKKVLVKFVKQSGRYNKGETAGFDKDQADKFEAQKVAKIVGEAKATTDTELTLAVDTVEVQKMIDDAQTEIEQRADDLKARADELDVADEQLKERASDLDAREQKFDAREKEADKAAVAAAKVAEKLAKDADGKPPSQGAAK